MGVYVPLEQGPPGRRPARKCTVSAPEDPFGPRTVRPLSPTLQVEGIALKDQVKETDTRTVSNLKGG